jgi:hypothetical protein
VKRRNGAEAWRVRFSALFGRRCLRASCEARNHAERWRLPLARGAGTALLSILSSPLPSAGMLSPMSTGQNHDFILSSREDEAVRESAEERTPHLGMNLWIL